MSDPFLSECQVCFAMVRPLRLLDHTNWHKDSKFTVVKVGENEWVAANEGGWIDEIFATESEAWEAVGSR